MIFEKIQLYCSEVGISIAAFERLCKIGNGAVGKWRNQTKPSVMSLMKIEHVTGIPLYQWLDDKEDFR